MIDTLAMDVFNQIKYCDSTLPGYDKRLKNTVEQLLIYERKGLFKQQDRKHNYILDYILRGEPPSFSPSIPLLAAPCHQYIDMVIKLLCKELCTSRIKKYV